MATIDLNTFTLGELEKLELMTGVSFADLENAFGQPKVIKTVLWIHALRTNPNASMDDFANLTLAEAAAYFTADDNPKAD